MNYLITKVLPDSLFSGEKSVINTKAYSKLISNCSKKCLVLSSPKGSGKTTLLSQFFKQTGYKYSYFKPDSEDENLFTFLNCLTDSIDFVLNDFKVHLADQLDYYQRSYSRKNFNKKEQVINFANVFINRLYQKTAAEFYIIIDGAEKISGNELTSFLLFYLIENLPPKIHIVLTLNHNQDFKNKLFPYQRNITEISKDDFKADAKFVKDIAGEIYDLKITHSAAETIVGKTDGWITGVHILLQYAINEINLPDEKDITKILFHYFQIQILNKEDDSFIKFLFLSACLEDFSAELLVSYYKKGECMDFINKLHSEYGYLIKDVNGIISYSDIFKEFLNNNLQCHVNEKQKNDIENKAGTFFLKKGEVKTAAKYFFRSKNMKQLIPVIIKEVPKLTKNSDFATLEYWFKNLDSCVLKKYPVLTYQKALFLKLYSFDFKKSVSELRCFLKLKSGEELKVKAMCHIAEMESILNDTANSIKKLEAYRRVVKNKKLLPELLFRLSSLYLKEQNFSKAQACCLEALDIIGGSMVEEVSQIKSNLLNELGNIKLYAADFQEAKSSYKKALTFITNKFHKVQTETNYLLALLNSGEFEEARKIFSDICGEKFLDEIPELKILKSITVINYYFEMLDFNRCLKEIEVVENLCNEYGSNGILVTALLIKAKIYFLKGNYSEGKEILKSQEKIKNIAAENERNTFEIYKLLSESKLEKAALISEEFNKAGMLPDYINALFFISKEAVKKRSDESFKKYFSKALALSTGSNYYNIAFQFFVYSREIFDAAIKRGLCKDEIALVTSEVIKFAASSDIQVKGDLLTDINVNFFGIPEIYIRGNKVKDSDWRRNKFKQIFLYIFLDRDSNISKDILIEEFFPESDSSYSDNIFHQFLSVLRSLLNKGNEYFKYENKIFYFNKSYIYSSDIEKIKRYYKKAQSIKSNLSLKKKYLEQATVFFKNEFMSGYYESREEDLRTDVNSLRFKIIQELAEIYKQESDFEKAIECFKILADEDELNEAYYYELISLYVLSGESNTARMKYKLMLEKFKKELGEKPSPQFLSKIKNLLLD
ncbi:MAG: tetratricopeptide repeat protein [Ignavibacteria bacterium]|nr:tetratricopeptide repeat protein [Ignavibacteria bacterium]